MKTLLAMGLISIAIIIITGCDYFGRKIVEGKPWPNCDKLANFSNGTACVLVNWPFAMPWSYRLLLAIPVSSPANVPLTRECPAFTGVVVIREESGKQVGSINISALTSQHCNWLQSYSLDAFIVGWQQTNCINTDMRPGKQYEITVSISMCPKEFTSLWLATVQSQDDRKRNRSRGLKSD